MVNILTAAKILGSQNLPYVDPPIRAVTVMDMCSEIEDYGRRILKASQNISSPEIKGK